MRAKIAFISSALLLSSCGGEQTNVIHYEGSYELQSAIQIDTEEHASFLDVLKGTKLILHFDGTCQFFLAQTVGHEKQIAIEEGSYAAKYPQVGTTIDATYATGRTTSYVWRGTQESPSALDHLYEERMVTILATSDVVFLALTYTFKV